MSKIFIEWVSGLVEVDPDSDLGRDVLYYIEKSGNKFTEDVRVLGISPNADCLPAYGRHWCLGWDINNKIFAVHFDAECEDESTYGKTFYDKERIDQYIDEYLV